MYKKLQAKLQQVWQRFLQLDKISKTICLASILGLVTLFINWYSDFDMYQNGVSYTALEGPASFNTFAIGLTHLLVLFFFLSRNFQELFAKLEITKRKLLVYAAVFMSFNVISYLSTILHHDVGINPNYKQLELGFELNILILFYYCLLLFKYLKAEDVEVSRYVMLDKDLTIADVVSSHKNPDLTDHYQQQQNIENRIYTRQVTK
mgnify:CR=1 FL=1